MPEKDFTDYLAADNEMIVRIETERGIVVNFRVQYQAMIDDVLYPVVRYDNAHGYPHRDLLDQNGDTIMETPVDGNLKDALRLAITDIKENWPRYRLAFTRRMR